MTPTTRVAGLLLLGTSLGLGGCATYGENGWGVRTWQSESPETIFRDAPATSAGAAGDQPAASGFRARMG